MRFGFSRGRVKAGGVFAAAAVAPGLGCMTTSNRDSAFDWGATRRFMRGFIQRHIHTRIGVELQNLFKRFSVFASACFGQKSRKKPSSFYTPIKTRVLRLAQDVAGN